MFSRKTQLYAFMLLWNGEKLEAVQNPSADEGLSYAFV